MDTNPYHQPITEEKINITGDFNKLFWEESYQIHFDCHYGLKCSKINRMEETKSLVNYDNWNYLLQFEQPKQ